MRHTKYPQPLNRKRATIMLLMCVLFSGCASVKVQSLARVPEPLVAQYAISAGLVIEPEFSNYVYLEEDKKRSIGEVSLGPSQAQVFTTVLGSMFSDVVVHDVAPTEGAQQLLFLPRLKVFQYALPGETGINVFEIWAKYGLRITDAQGQLISDWELTAYGKSEDRTFSGTGKIFSEALNYAIRDLGVNLVVGLPKVPALKDWIEQYQRTSTPTQTPPVPEG